MSVRLIKKYSLIFLFIASLGCSSSKKSTSSSPDYDSYCKVIVSDSFPILEKLRSRLQAKQIEDSVVFGLSDPSTTNVTYVRYDGPTGFLLLVKVNVDSTGTFRSYKIIKSMLADKYPKEVMADLGKIQTLHYQSMIGKREFRRTSCYVTDASDVFLVVNNKNGLTSGLSVVNLQDYAEFGSDYASFLSYCNDIMFQLSKKAK